MDERSLSDAIARALDAHGPLEGSVWLRIQELGHLRIEATTVEACGDCDDCSATISVHRDHFERVVRGDLDPLSAVMTGKVRIRGSLPAAGRFARILGKAREGGLI